MAEKGCKIVSMSRHKRCFCNGQLSKHSRCGLKTHYGTPKRRAAKSKGLAKCAPKSVRWVKGGGCGCKTVGGGFKRVNKSICTSKYKK